MKEKGCVWNHVIDGVGCAVMLQLLVEYAGSVYLFAPESNFERDAVRLFVLCVLGAFLSAAFFVRLVCREQDAGRLCLRFLISAVSGVVSCCAITAVLKLVLRISLLPLRALGNGDGLILLMMGALFAAISFALRSLAVLGQLLKCHWAKRGK